MKMISRVLFVLITMNLIGLNSNGQALKNFTADPLKYSQEMQGFLEETDKKEAGKIMEELGSSVLHSRKQFTELQMPCFEKE